MPSWFKKNWTTRKNEVINFIRNAPVPPANAGRRQLIAYFLEYGDLITQPMSEGMSQGHYRKIGRSNATIADMKDTRSYRRACIAIRCAILGHALPAASAAVSVIPNGLLPATLGADLHLAYLNVVAALTAQLNNLRNNPAIFLANNPLAIVQAAAAGNTPYVFYYDPIDHHHVLAPNTVLQGGQVLTGNPARPVAHVACNAFNVAVHQYNTIVNLAAIPGDLLNGVPPLMVTEKLTGCSFMFQTAGLNMTATHIQPAGANPLGRGFALAVNLRANAAFGNANNVGNLQVFGAQALEAQPLDYFPGNFSYIIGLVRNGVWEIHVQLRNRYSLAHELVGSWQVH